MLRGLGATIALPLLELHAARQRRAAAAAAVGEAEAQRVPLHPQRREHAHLADHRRPARTTSSATPLKSLEKHRADITPISGLHHPMVLGKHHNCDKVWLTGAKVPGDGGAFRNTVSADQLMAEVQGADDALLLARTVHRGQLARLVARRHPASRRAQPADDLQHALRRREGRQRRHPPPAAPPRQHPRSRARRREAREQEARQRRPHQARRIPHRRPPGRAAHRARRLVAQRAEARGRRPTTSRASRASSSRPRPANTTA